LASGGKRLSSPAKVTTGKKPRCRNCAAASKPSPPLLPGPQATQIVRACGAMAIASRATARPARCISVWAGRAVGRGLLDAARGRDVEQIGGGGGRDALHRSIVPPRLRGYRYATYHQR
jgi:hypothetical protein